MENIYLSPRSALAMRDMYNAPRDPLVGNPIGAFGIPIHSSNIFPYESTCEPCSGSGEGSTSTYCLRCKGAGAIRYEGMVTNGMNDFMMGTGRGVSTILITSPLPKKFHHGFPSGLVPPPILSRGLM